MIKLIVSDIDGTLTKDGGNKLNPELFSVIMKLKEKGIHFAAVSGRQAASLETLFEPIRDQIFYVGDNGAYVSCYGRNLFLTEIRRKTAVDFIKDIREAGLEVMLGGAEYVYVDSKNEEYVRWLMEGYQFKMRRVRDVRWVKGPIIKVSACCMDGIGNKADGLMKKYRRRLKLTPSGSQWVDGMHLSVSKGNAVKLLQESLFIRPEETMAFGDQLNDVEMLKQAYYSYAVENARPEVKETARFLADSNEDDGVLKVLRLLL